MLKFGILGALMQVTYPGGRRRRCKMYVVFVFRFYNRIRGILEFRQFFRKLLHPHTLNSGIRGIIPLFQCNTVTLILLIY